MNLPEELLRARAVLWDFDGVIKDSVDVKTRAFVAMFTPFGAHVAEQVREHHEAHGGMSRFDKIPHYLSLAGVLPTEDRVAALCAEFGTRVVDEVIRAPWVPGVESYLRSNPRSQHFALISATPKDELCVILDRLDLASLFEIVHGAPTSKAHGVADALARLGLAGSECVFIGDALSDQAAAAAHGVPFVLRRHESNTSVFRDYQGPSLERFDA